MPQPQIKNGLKLLPPDNRDFSFGKVYGSIPLEELPESFELKPFSVKNQLDSDYCSAFASCGMSELQEKVELSPEWEFAISKKMSGDKDEYGQDMRTAMKVHIKHGALEKKECPYILGVQTDEFLRDIANWPDLFCKAEKHKKKSYFKVSNKYDPFDNIRVSIYMMRAFKRAVSFGTQWGWDMAEEIIPDKICGGSGHMLYILGWRKINNEIYLSVQNSYGKDVGDNGKFYFPRSVVNEMVGLYGAYMFTDMLPEEVKKKIQRLSWRDFFKEFLRRICQRNY